jgi:hypothetical protein
MRMIQLSNEVRFANKGLNEIRFLSIISRQNFNGDITIKFGVVSLVDVAIAP